MTDLGHDSVEGAAMEGFPTAHCRVVASRTFESDGYVLLDTGSPGQPYLYASNCYRRDGRWFEAGSTNGPGWAQTSHDPDLGTLSFWGDVVPSPAEWPHIVAIRENGAWRAVQSQVW